MTTADDNTCDDNKTLINPSFQSSVWKQVEFSKDCVAEGSNNVLFGLLWCRKTTVGETLGN